MPSVFLLFGAVTLFSLTSVGSSQFRFSTDHHEDLQRISGVTENVRGDKEERAVRCGGVVWWCVFVCFTTNLYQGCVTARALSVRSSLQNMAGEELAHHVVGNDSGMYKAGFAGDDAPRAVPYDAKQINVVRITLS